MFGLSAHSSVDGYGADRRRSARIRFGALVLRPAGSGVQTYARELVSGLAALLPAAELSAVVQRDATGELPDSVHAISKPVVAGARRAALALAPMRNVDLVHALDVDLPVATHAARVATVHDMSVFDAPWAYSRARAMGERVLLRSSLHRADVLLAVSDFTAERVQALIGRECIVTPPNTTRTRSTRARCSAAAYAVSVAREHAVSTAGLHENGCMDHGDGVVGLVGERDLEIA